MCYLVFIKIFLPSFVEILLVGLDHHVTTFLGMTNEEVAQDDDESTVIESASVAIQGQLSSSLRAKRRNLGDLGLYY